MEAQPPYAIALRKTLAKHPEVKELLASLEDVVRQVNAALNAGYFRGIPINVPFAFRASAVGSTFSLGNRFVPCDGRPIVDKASPLHGQTAPVITSGLGGAETLTWYIRIRD